MLFVNLTYAFLLGVLCQKVLYKVNESINYKYNKKYQDILNILTGIFFVCFWIEYKFSIEFFILSLCTTILISTSIIDTLYLEIPDEHNLLILLWATTYSMINPELFTYAITGSLIGGGFYLLLAILSKGGMGGGDIKLAASTGLLLGPTNTITCIYLAFFIAFVGFIHNIYISVANKEKMKSEIAFGPYISISVIIIFLGLI